MRCLRWVGSAQGIRVGFSRTADWALGTQPTAHLAAQAVDAWILEYLLRAVLAGRCFQRQPALAVMVIGPRLGEFRRPEIGLALLFW